LGAVNFDDKVKLKYHMKSRDKINYEDFRIVTYLLSVCLYSFLMHKFEEKKIWEQLILKILFEEQLNTDDIKLYSVYGFHGLLI
jgi:hypothetical protein